MAQSHLVPHESVHQDPKQSVCHDVMMKICSWHGQWQRSELLQCRASWQAADAASAGICLASLHYWSPASQPARQACVWPILKQCWHKSILYCRSIRLSCWGSFPSKHQQACASCQPARHSQAERRLLPTSSLLDALLCQTLTRSL